MKSNTRFQKKKKKKDGRHEEQQALPQRQAPDLVSSTSLWRISLVPNQFDTFSKKKKNLPYKRVLKKDCIYCCSHWPVGGWTARGSQGFHSDILGMSASSSFACLMSSSIWPELMVLYSCFMTAFLATHASFFFFRRVRTLQYRQCCCCPRQRLVGTL